MIVRKAYMYRLKTKSCTDTVLAQYAGCCRFVWNKALALQNERLQAGERCLAYGKLALLLPAWKEEHPFLKEAPSQALQQSLMNLDRALRDAFDKKSPKQFPQFKKKGLHDSFRIPQGFELNGQAVKLPKLGWIGYRNSRPIEGTPKNITVSRCSGKWYVAIQVELEIENPVPATTSTIGIDLGIARFAALSDGSHIEPVNSFRKAEQKLAKLQRRLARKLKFSRNWQKQKREIQKLHTHIAAKRHDFLHKASHTISKNHAMIVMEELQVANMSASARGTRETPGRNVRQKAGLNKAILDQGWGELRRQLGYKALWRGGLLVLVPPQYTSQSCSVCGHQAAENRLTQERFCCLSCGHTENADVNAAKNIKAAGQRRVSLWRAGVVNPLGEAETTLAA